MTGRDLEGFMVFEIGCLALAVAFVGFVAGVAGTLLLLWLVG